MTKILIIEDDNSIRSGLEYFLSSENFNVLTSCNAHEGLQKILNNKDLDIILLDVNLPDISGFDLFNNIKDIKNIPIIFLTANDLEVSIVRGLDMGADDYITKPFKAKELVSRVNNVLRRTKNIEQTTIKYGKIEVDLMQARVTKNGKDIFLTSLEYKIFITLALNPKIIFTREKLLAEVWDVNEEYVNDNALSVYIKRIREKIEENPANPKIIVTVRGTGYKIGEYYV